MPRIVSFLLGDFGAIVIALKEEEGRGKNEENLLWECQFGFTSVTFFLSHSSVIFFLQKEIGNLGRFIRS